MKDPPILAELLLDMARIYSYPKDELVTTVLPLSDAELARVKLALDFARLPAGRRFQAIVEDWDKFRIVREVY
jgi:hypothetical protein